MTNPNKSTGNVFGRILLLAALIGAVGLGINFYYGPEGHGAVPNLDVLLFHHYARAMVEGHPYRFNAIDPASTGSTSHLFPVLLALFYGLGLRGDALTTANLFLNFGAWLGALALIYAIARRLDRGAAVLAMLLCALSGQTFISFFLLTDIGVFTVLALGAYAAALYGRTGWLCAALVAAAWCRPEGLILSGVLAAMGGLMWRLGKGGAIPSGSSTNSLRRLVKAHRPVSCKGMVLVGVAGLAAFGGVFALNDYLTGQFQFQSVHNKNVIAGSGLAGGMHQFTATLGEFIVQGLFNLNDQARVFYGFPILSGMLGLAGVAARVRRRAGTGALELWWGLAVLASVALVAFSGWEGIQYDKYWAWFLPVWTIYVAMGVREVARLGKLRFADCRLIANGKRKMGMALAGVLLAWQAAGLVHFVAEYHQNCAFIAPIVRFTKQAAGMLPADARVGCWGATGLAYYLEKRPVFNVVGIGAPQYMSPEDPIQSLELLRHRRDLRFDWWLLAAPDSEQWLKPMVGAQVSAAPPVFGAPIAFTLHKTAWDAVEGTTLPLSGEGAKAGMRLADSLDVGYAADEARCGYELFTRIPGARIGLFTARGDLGKRNVYEVGRVVIGAETFRMRVVPGRAARLVLRGALTAEAAVAAPPDGQMRSQSFEFVAPLGLNVLVDGETVGKWTIGAAGKGSGAGAGTEGVEGAKENFFEAGFDLPAEALKTGRPEITIGGDHISLGYWIYQ